jgi:hypothetical protein
MEWELEVGKAADPPFAGREASAKKGEGRMV